MSKEENRLATRTEESAEKLSQLCKISDKEILAEFPRWKLARAKTVKGRSERLMLCVLP